MIDKQILKIKGMKSLMIKLVGISFLQALFILFQCIFLSKIITNLFKGQSLEKQTIYIALFAFNFVMRQVIHTISEKLSSHFAHKAAMNMRGDLMKKIYKLGPCLVQKEGTGTMAVTVMEGISNIENYISIISIKIIEMMVIPTTLIIAILYNDILSGLILIAVFPIVIIFMALFGNAAKAKADRQYKGYKLLSNHFIDSLQGLDSLKILGKSGIHSKNVYKVSEGYRKATMNTLKIAILSTFALDFFTTLSIAIVAVFLGLRLLKGEMSLYPAMTVLILAPEFFFPLRQFAEDYHATLDGKNAMKDVNRVKEIEELKENNILSDDFSYGENTKISVQNLSFSYEKEKNEEIKKIDDKIKEGRSKGPNYYGDKNKEKNSINNTSNNGVAYGVDKKSESRYKDIDKISFDVEGYKNICIIGYSGAGKSTLLNLLGGFLCGDDGSSFVVDGKTLPSLTDKNWQKEIIFIPQNPYIFSGSILDNMRFYNEKASIEEVEAVIDKVGLRDMVSEMENGIYTKVGEGGRMVSGGQAQRIAIARAFLSPNRKILLLDEPTAHLDIETEVELKKYILELSKNRLMFLSTHRLHWAKDMDEIMVIQNGRLVERGSFFELNTKDSEYAKLARKMRGDLDE